ncbi:MAG: PKD domain-containing protein [Aureispira sp.]|nr:PKD domain-containing protein [Aureispira sp.]
MKTLQNLTMAVLMCLAAFGAQAQCTANFTSSGSALNPGVISFTSTVSGFQTNMTSYTWTYYGLNGNVLGYSYTANPTYTYTTNGQYLACLTVTDSLCTSTTCDSVVVSGISSNPCSGFGANFTYSTTPNGTTFSTSLTGGTPGYQYSWDFGDNSFGSGANPTHTYANGTYLACVTVWDGNGCSTTECDTVVIGSGTGNPCTGFSVAMTSSNTATGTTLTATTTGGTPAYTYSWDFGDNTSGTGQTATHNYANGSYLACVVATDANGCTSTTCDSVVVSTSGSNPCSSLTANFTFNSNPGGANTVGQFSSVVSGGNAPYTYVWTIGNTTVTTANPNWQFAGNGAHSVCLTVYDANGCIATKCDSVLITNSGTGNPCASLAAAFSYTPTAGTTNTGQFNATVTGGSGPYTYAWTIGNNTVTTANPTWQFSAAGTYNVCLTVTDVNGCAVTTCNLVTVSGGNPCGNISVSYTISQNTTNPFVLYLQPVVTGMNMNPANSGLSFVWSWGDNTGTVWGSMPSHQYGTTGSYVVCLTATDTTQGCTYTYCDTIAMDTSGNFSRNAGGFIINTLPTQYNTVTSVVDKEINAQSSMAVFPNPVSRELTINLNSVADSDAQIAVFDLNGQQVINKVVNVAEGEQQFSLPVNNLPAGMYIIRMQGERLQHTEKFIKQ